MSETWEARVLRFGLDRDGLRWDAHLGPALARLLVHSPVRAHRVAGRFLHPADPFIVVEATVAGLVMAAWSDAAGVYAQFVLADEVEWLSRGLHASARDARLHLIGVSPVLSVGVAHTEEMGRPARRVHLVREIRALDLVDAPKGDGAHLLRSVSVSHHVPESSPSLERSCL